MEIVFDIVRFFYLEVVVRLVYFAVSLRGIFLFISLGGACLWRFGFFGRRSLVVVASRAAGSIFR